MAPDPIAARARGRRARTLAALAPILGLFLLTPPFILPFAGGAVAGAPVIVAYVFGVWAFLIVITRLIARRIAAGEDFGEDVA